MNVQNITRVLRQGELEHKSARRADAVLRAWYRPNPAYRDRDPNSAFLYKIACDAEGNVSADSMLRACERFIDFFRHVWLDSLYEGRYELFVPEYSLTKRLLGHTAST